MHHLRASPARWRWERRGRDGCHVCAWESRLPAGSLVEQREQENEDSVWAERRLLQGPLEDPGAVTQNSNGLAGNGLCSAVRGDSFQEPPPFLPLAIARGA